MRTTQSASGCMFYSVELPVKYKLVTPDVGAGTGWTVRISSQAVVFESDRLLQSKEEIQLTLEWPVLLPDGVALSLCAVGTIERADRLLVEVSFLNYVFRTRGKDHIEADSSRRVRARGAHGISDF